MNAFRGAVWVVLVGVVSLLGCGEEEGIEVFYETGSPQAATWEQPPEAGSDAVAFESNTYGDEQPPLAPDVPDVPEELEPWEAAALEAPEPPEGERADRGVVIIVDPNGQWDVADGLVADPEGEAGLDVDGLEAADASARATVVLLAEEYDLLADDAEELLAAAEAAAEEAQPLPEDVPQPTPVEPTPSAADEPVVVVPPAPYVTNPVVFQSPLLIRYYSWTPTPVYAPTCYAAWGPVWTWPRRRLWSRWRWPYRRLALYRPWFGGVYVDPWPSSWGYSSWDGDPICTITGRYGWDPVYTHGTHVGFGLSFGCGSGRYWGSFGWSSYPSAYWWPPTEYVVHHVYHAHRWWGGYDSWGFSGGWPRYWTYRRPRHSTGRHRRSARLAVRSLGPVDRAHLNRVALSSLRRKTSAPTLTLGRVAGGRVLPRLAPTTTVLRRQAAPGARPARSAPAAASRARTPSRSLRSSVLPYSSLRKRSTDTTPRVSRRREVYSEMLRASEIRRTSSKGRSPAGEPAAANTAAPRPRRSTGLRSSAFPLPATSRRATARRSSAGPAVSRPTPVPQPPTRRSATETPATEAPRRPAAAPTRTASPFRSSAFPRPSPSRTIPRPTPTRRPSPTPSRSSTPRPSVSRPTPTRRPTTVRPSPSRTIPRSTPTVRPTPTPSRSSTPRPSVSRPTPTRRPTPARPSPSRTIPRPTPTRRPSPTPSRSSTPRPRVSRPTPTRRPTTVRPSPSRTISRPTPRRPTPAPTRSRAPSRTVTRSRPTPTPSRSPSRSAESRRSRPSRSKRQDAD